MLGLQNINFWPHEITDFIRLTVTIEREQNMPLLSTKIAKYRNPVEIDFVGFEFHGFAVSIMKVNIANPATGAQKLIDIDDERRV